MKAQFEFHELVNFADNLQNESRDKELQFLIRKLVSEFLQNVKQFTPVMTGNLRNHWDIDNKNIQIRKLKNGYSVTVYNKASKTTKEGNRYFYGSWVDQGHQSYNQFGGPYIVRNSKYGLNGGPVIGRFFVEDAMNKTTSDIRKDVTTQLQNWLDRCVNNAK